MLVDAVITVDGKTTALLDNGGVVRFVRGEQVVSMTVCGARLSEALVTRP